VGGKHSGDIGDPPIRMDRRIIPGHELTGEHDSLDFE
jgi:hypothetical protein